MRWFSGKNERGNTKELMFLDGVKVYSIYELIALLTVEKGLRNELLALALLESQPKVSIGELVALVFIEHPGPFSSFELVAPLASAIETTIEGLGGSLVEMSQRNLHSVSY